MNIASCRFYPTNSMENNTVIYQPQYGSHDDIRPRDIYKAHILEDYPHDEHADQPGQVTEAEHVSPEMCRDDQHGHVEQLAARGRVRADDGVHDPPGHHDDDEERQGARDVPVRGTERVREDVLPEARLPARPCLLLPAFQAE